MTTSTPTIITPTVGRVVWYYPPTNSAESGFARPDGSAPLAAIIARVWSDTMLNLTVFDANGAPHSRTSVALIQDGQATPEHYGHCEWMPFQKGQAKALGQLPAYDSSPICVRVGPYTDAERARARPLPVRDDHREEPATAAALGAIRAGVHKALDKGLMHHMTGAADIVPATAVAADAVCAAAGYAPPHCDFGDAIRHLKAGRRVARAGWNGKGMWLCFVDWYQYQLTELEHHVHNTPQPIPWIGMRTADNGFVPWLASQTDMLAEDWVVVE